MALNIAYAAVVSVIFAAMSKMLLEIYYFTWTLLTLLTNDLIGSKILRERDIFVFTKVRNIIDYKTCLVAVLIGNTFVFVPALLWLTVDTKTELKRIDSSIDFSGYARSTPFDGSADPPVYLLNSRKCSGLRACIELSEPLNKAISIPGKKIGDDLALSSSVPGALDKTSIKATNYLEEVDYYGIEESLWLSKLECAAGVNISIHRAVNGTRYNNPDTNTAREFLTLPYSQNHSQSSDGFPVSYYSEQAVGFIENSCRDQTLGSRSFQPDVNSAQSTYTTSIEPICYNKNVNNRGSIGMLVLEETWMLLDKYEKRYDFIADYKRMYCKDFTGASFAPGGKCGGEWLYVKQTSDMFGNASSMLTEESIATANELNVRAKSNNIYRCPCEEVTDSKLVAQTAALVSNKYNARSSRTKDNQHMSILCLRSANDIATACKIMRIMLYPVKVTNTFNQPYENLIYHTNFAQKIENIRHVGCMELDTNTPELIASENYITAVNQTNARITKLHSNVSYDVKAIVVVFAGVIVVLRVIVKIVGSVIGRSKYREFTNSLTGLD